MLQLDNQTPFKATIALLPDRFGIDTLYVIVKATVTLRPSLALAEEQVPPTMADEYYGDPAASSLRAVSDMHIGKAGTDVLLIGKAWAPDKRPVQRMQVAHEGRRPTEADTRDRRSRLAGRRAVAATAVRVDAAHLGACVRRRASRRRQGRGRGAQSGGLWICRRTLAPTTMQGLPVPNLEDPAAPLQQIGQVADAGMPGADRAVVAATPRVCRHLRRALAAQRARRICRTTSIRASSSARRPSSRSIAICRPASTVQIVGVLPDGPIAFTVPDSHLSVAVTVDGSMHRPPANLETLSIEPDENRACFTWRAAVPCDRQVLKVQKIVVSRAGAALMSAVIGATHVLCAIGSGTDQVWASARAGIARIGSSHVMDRHFEPISDGTRARRCSGATRRRRSTSFRCPRGRAACCGWPRHRFEAVAKDVARPGADLHRASGS